MQYHQEGPPRHCSVRPRWPPPGVVRGESEEGGGGQRGGGEKRERKKEGGEEERGGKEGEQRLKPNSHVYYASQQHAPWGHMRYMTVT